MALANQTEPPHLNESWLARRHGFWGQFRNSLEIQYLAAQAVENTTFHAPKPIPLEKRPEFVSILRLVTDA